MNKELNQTQRFSGKAEFYAKYRPRYPEVVVEILTDEGILSNKTIIADIGSGTGLLSKLFLDFGNIVYGIEPNEDMRGFSETFLEEYEKFTSLDGTAEETHLASKSIDLVVVGQAFHFFDPINARREFKRILKPKKRVVLVWNKRETGDTLYGDFLQKYSKDFEEIKSLQVNYEMFFNSFKHVQFSNPHSYDFEGLKGLTLSASYFPTTFTLEMLNELKTIFDKTNINGRITFEYIANLYFGTI